MATLNVLIVVTVLCWSIWGIFDKKALEKSNFRDVLLYVHAFYFLSIPVTVIVMNWQCPGWHMPPEVLLWTGLAAAGQMVAEVVYLIAMTRVEASFVLGITASYPLVTQLLAAFFLGESLLLSRLGGALLMALGIATISSSGGSMSGKFSRSDWFGLLFCLALATVSWGAVGICDKKAILLASPLIVFYGHLIWGAAGFFLFYTVFRVSGYKIDFRSGRTWSYCGLSAVCLILGFWTYLGCLSMSSVSYVITITSCYPVFMYLFAMLLLKERYSWLRMSGIALVVIGTIVVQQSQTSGGGKSDLISAVSRRITQMQKQAKKTI